MPRKSEIKSLEKKPHPLEGQYIVLGYRDSYGSRYADIPVLYKVIGGEYEIVSDLDLMAMNDYMTGESDFRNLLIELKIKKVFFIEPKLFGDESIFSDVLGGGEYDNGKGVAGFYATTSLKDGHSLYSWGSWDIPLPEGFEVFVYDEKTGKISRCNYY
jgi:hypothetical protein